MNKDISKQLTNILLIIFIVVLIIFTYHVGVYNTIKINEYCGSCGLSFDPFFRYKYINVTISDCQTIIYPNQTECIYCINGSVICKD